MSSREPSPAELLRAIERLEGLHNTLASFPGLTVDRARHLLAHAASTCEGMSGAPPAPTSGASRRRDLEPSSPRAARVLRVYSDGAARGNPGLAGAGAILTLPTGEVVERLGLFLGSQTNNHAEYMGAILGLERARALGAEEVELLADSQLLIRQLSGRYQVRSATLRPLYQQAQALLAGFRRHTLTHLPREENREADAMSNRAIDERLTGHPV
jgi:ribonuclease HI